MLECPPLRSHTTLLTMLENIGSRVEGARCACALNLRQSLSRTDQKTNVPPIQFVRLFSALGMLGRYPNAR